MNPMRLPRERLLLVGALACMLLLGLDRLALTPFLRAWRSRADEILRLRAEIDRATALMEQESRWLRWRDDAANRLLPGAPGDAENQLIGRVDGWARSAGLAVSSLRPRWTEGPDRAQRLELQVAGSGSLQAVSTFLYQVETSSVAVALEQMELVPRNNEGTDIVLDVRLCALCQGAGNKGGSKP